MRQRLAAFAFLVAWPLPLGVEMAMAAEQTDVVLKALASCSPAFFDVLATNKTTFGPVTAKPLENPNAKRPKALQVEGSVVSFATPVEALGLPLTGYTQEMVLQDGVPLAFRWGFETSEKSSVVAAALGDGVPAAQFRQQDDSYGWVQEVEPTWRGPEDGLQHKGPLRMLILEPKDDGSGTHIRCVVVRKSNVKMSTLPEIGNLFTLEP